MRRLFLCLLLLLGLGAAHAQRQKMSAFVRELAAASQQRSQPGRRRALAEGQLCAFVEVEGDVGRTLRDHDCRLLARQGRVGIALIPLSRLESLAASPLVSRIEASRSCRLTMDTTRLVTHALPVYQGRALPQAYDGSGVVLGIMDVGFDFTHPTFLDASGRCRVSRFWDQLSPDTVGSPWPVGRDYGADELPPHSTDGYTETHGTHTLGIAAGSGAGSPYVGMAPGADLCAVSNAVTSDTLYIAPEDYARYTSAVDALGFKYIFDYAERQHRPCVISFSEGYYPDFSGEDRLYAQFVDSLLGPGRLLVTSSGNESVHLSNLLKPQGVERVGSFVYSGDTEGYFVVRSRGDFRLSLLAYDEERSRVADSLSFRLSDVDSLLTLGGEASARPYSLTAERYPSALDSTETVVWLTLRADAPLHQYSLAVALEGADAQAELWSYATPLLNQAPWTDAQVRSNVLQPGCIRRVVTVGSTAHRTGFTNYKGVYYDYTDSGSGGLWAPYSSVGPTPEGLVKPDVVAPGNNVVSSYSSYYLERNSDARDIRSDVAHFEYAGRTYAWNANTGTSMATPVVAGAVALWLQARPDLTPDDVLSLLSLTCRRPDPSASYPNNRYGYGEIDVYRGLLRLLGIDAVGDVSLHQPSAVRISLDAAGRLRLSLPANAADAPASARLRLFDLSGRPVYDSRLQLSSPSLSVQLPPLPPAVYAVQLDSPSSSLTGSSLVRVGK